jgi:HD-GYP domain-containing protein (c-di-GMP phosphodiesterase class II)
MLKRIPVSALRLGMHLHALEATWLAHSFWKTKFVIRDPDDLRKLHASGVSECLIDIALGDDLPAPVDDDELMPTQPGVFRDAPQAAGVPKLPAPAQQTTLREELQQAAAICNRGRAAVVSMFREARMGRAVDAEACAPLVEEITSSVARNPGALVSLARLKTADEYTYMHSVAVCALMIALGRQMGFDEPALRAAGMAGLLHDMGKALIDPAVLNKPGKLTEAEFAEIKKHPQLGHDLLTSGRAVGAGALDVCLNHHQRIDGTGYPRRLAADQISTLARMGAVCDVYDAITSNRPYKAGWDPAESIARMASWKGHFDAAVFAAFVKSLGIYPTGSLVRLESGKLAVVVEQNPEKITAPKVKAIYSTKSSMPITPQEIDLARSNDRIVGRESPAKWGFTWIEEVWLPPELDRRKR